MHITRCEICGDPIFKSPIRRLEDPHICSSLPRKEYFGPLGENKTFTEKMEDAQLMYGELEDV